MVYYMFAEGIERLISTASIFFPSPHFWSSFFAFPRLKSGIVVWLNRLFGANPFSCIKLSASTLKVPVHWALNLHNMEGQVLTQAQSFAAKLMYKAVIPVQAKPAIVRNGAYDDYLKALQ